MVAKRIIPCLDVDRGRVVKGVQFIDIVDAGDPVEQARFYDQAGADELVFLDITATHEARGIIHEVVRKTADQVFIPLTVGGGIRTVGDIHAMLNAGADKIAINSAALQHPELIADGAAAFGSQCIVVAIDAKRVANSPIRWEVFTHGGKQPTGIDVLAWAKSAAQKGAGELLVTSMDRDGTRDGYDLALFKALDTLVDIPVIASGGAGNLEHLKEGFIEGKADAVLAASIFHFREYSIREAKSYLKTAGIHIRQTF